MPATVAPKLSRQGCRCRGRSLRRQPIADLQERLGRLEARLSLIEKILLWTSYRNPFRLFREWLIK